MGLKSPSTRNTHVKNRLMILSRIILGVYHEMIISKLCLQASISWHSPPRGDVFLHIKIYVEKFYIIKYKIHINYNA